MTQKIKTKKGQNNRPYVKKEKKAYDPNKSKNFMKNSWGAKESTYKAAQANTNKDVKVTKKKLEVTKYTRITNDFTSGIIDILTILPESISNLFDCTKDATTQFDMTRKIAEVAAIKLPNFETRENIFWEYKIAANRVYVKTDEYCSFGWFTKSVEKVDGNFIPTYSFFIELFGDNFQMESLLKQYGFEEEVPVKVVSKTKPQTKYKKPYNKKPYNKNHASSDAKVNNNYGNKKPYSDK